MSLLRRHFLQDMQAQEEPSLARWLRKLGRGTGRILFCILCAAASACLFTLSYPHYSHAWLAWVALAPFTMALLYCRSFWTSLWYSWFTGTLVYGGLYYWIFVTCYRELSTICLKNVNNLQLILL